MELELKRLPDDVIKHIRSFIYIEPEFWEEYKKQLKKYNYSCYYGYIIDYTRRNRNNILMMSFDRYNHMYGELQERPRVCLIQLILSYHNRKTINALCKSRYNKTVSRLNMNEIVNFIKWYNYKCY